MKTSRLQLGVCLRVGTFGDDVVRHVLARFLPAWLAGCRGMQAYLRHLRGPLPIVIAASRRLAVGLLPDMRHFMGECREHFFVGLAGEAVRVKGHFIEHESKIEKASASAPLTPDSLLFRRRSTLCSRCSPPTSTVQERLLLAFCRVCIDRKS